MNLFRFLLCIIFISYFSLGFGVDVKNSKKIIGIYENIILLPDGIKMPAKLDTGADSSSIHGENVKIYEKDGKKYVRFLFIWDKNGIEEELKIEKQLERYAKIKRKGQLTSDRRPVVNLEFCLDGKKYNDEFTIADRDNFNYPLLLGREFLRKYFIIDPDSDYITDANACNQYIKDEK